MMESTAVNYNLFEFFVSQSSVRSKNVAHLSDVIIFLQSFSSFNNIFAIFDRLSSGVYKNEHLLVLFKIIKCHFIASFIKDVSNVSLF
jgi:hypothetical protein